MHIQDQLRSMIYDARFESSEKLHITLQFIGEFDRSRVSELFSSIAVEAEKLSTGFSSVRITGMNYFPNEKIRRGIWLDCKDDGTLAKIVDTIKSTSKRFGIAPEDRPFKAHITIARLSGKHAAAGVHFGRMDNVGDLKKFEGEGKLLVEEFFPMSIVLFESVLKSSGSEYKVLSQVPL